MNLTEEVKRQEAQLYRLGKEMAQDKLKLSNQESEIRRLRKQLEDWENDFYEERTV